MGLLEKLRTKPTNEPSNATQEVVTYYPSDRPYVGRSLGGIWIADFGPECVTDPQVFAAVERVVTTHPKSLVLWVLQGSAINGAAMRVAQIAAWLRQFHRLTALRGTVSEQKDVGVLVAGRSASTCGLTALFSSLGVELHSAGADDSIFVEVRRPDGIAARIPGVPLGPPTGDRALSDLNRWRDRVEASGGPVSLTLAQIEARERAFIEQTFRVASRAA